MCSDENSKSVGLIGLGLVGSAIAEHLLGAGHRVIGYDIDPAACQALRQRGGHVVGSPAEVAAQADPVILALMTSAIVRQVIDGADGLLTSAAPPRLIIDISTGLPQDSIALAAQLRQQGIQFLDAPISGSSQQIRDGDALFMVGGAKLAYRNSQALLAVISKKVVYVGPSGSGAKAKLASNLILGLNRLVLAEGLVFAEQIGLDPQPFLALLKQSPAYSVAMDAKGEKMIRGDFSPQAKVSQHAKDLQLILDSAGACDLTLPMAEVHQQILAQLIADGDGDLDNSAVIKVLRKRRTR